MTILFANISFFYWALGLFIILWCGSVNTRASISSALVLAALIIPSGLPSQWSTPESMGLWHLATVMCICLFFEGRMGLKLATLTFLMVITDVVYIFAPAPGYGALNSQFPYGLFWWQSILNVLYLIHCIVISIGCYNSRRIARYKRRLGNDNFYARESQSKGTMG